MNETNFSLYRRITIVFLMIVLVAVITALSMIRINQRAEQQCWETLQAYAKMLNNDIRIITEGDRTLLRAVAKLIANHDLLESPDLADYLREFETDDTITRIGLLLPDDTVVFSDGVRYDVSGKLSFQKVAELGEHLSDKTDSVSHDLGPVIRNFVPVQKDGKTVAMLYGAIELARLPNLDKLKYLGFNVAIYLIDGNTGDFLLDTWHNKLGNILEFGHREMKAGYEQKKMNENILGCRAGHAVFISKTIGDYIYFYYEPSGINRWIAAVSIPEDVMFAEAIAIRKLMLYLAAFECACFALYFIWVCFDARREADAKQRRLDTISYIYDVEKILFTAHREKRHINTALERVCRMAGAKDAFFAIYGNDVCHQAFVYSADATSDFPAELQANGYYQSYCLVRKDVMIVPITDVDGNSIGALGIHAWKTRPDIAGVLDSVAPSFTLLYNNIKNFNKIKEMSEKDMLTGMLNRNSFENGLSMYHDSYSDSIAVIYVDANGLHELNNSQGHEAGDRMLRFVARKIMEQFGAEHAYRIGGDEFVAFAADTDGTEIRNRINLIEAELTREGYHASFGMASAQKGSAPDMDSLLKMAEQEMYDEKKRWYEQQGRDRRAR